MNITSEIKKLRKIMPNAVITFKQDKPNCITYECDLRWANITPEEHDSYFAPIKELFGDRLLERYSFCTGHFDIYVRPESNPVDEKEIKKIIKEVAWSAWQSAANAYRMYPDSKHTFIEYWENFGEEKCNGSVLSYLSFKKDDGCICEVGHPYNNLCCPIHSTPVKREGEEAMPDYWKYAFKEWLTITLNISLPIDRIIELIISHVDFYIKSATTPSPLTVDELKTKFAHYIGGETWTYEKLDTRERDTLEWGIKNLK